MLSQDEFIAVVTALTVALALVFTLALAGPSTPVQATGAPTASASGPAGCLEWTDGCVVCQRNGTDVACSTPGIACTRGAQQCLRR